MTTLALIFALLTTTGTGNASRGSHYYDAVNPKLGNVPHCIYGSMTLKDNGMLVGANGQTVDFHQLMAQDDINGIPEETAIDATIQVCQNGGKLVYTVQ